MNSGELNIGRSASYIAIIRHALSFSSPGFFVFLVVLLLGMSVLMVSSTTLAQHTASGMLDLGLLIRHLISIGVGLLLAYIIFTLPLSLIIKSSPLLLVGGIITLVAVLIPGIGVVGGGARRWIPIGPFTLQPSEFVKVFMVLYMSGYLARHRENLNRFKVSILVPGLILLLLIALLLGEPDFGASVVLLGVVGMQLYCVAPLKYFLSIGSLAIASLLGVMMLSPYRVKRLTGFMDPFSDPTGAGYQLIQSLVAVGTGGSHGVGLGMSEQKLSYLPAAHTDFIFAVIAEELGFVGASVVALIYLLIAVWGIKLALRNSFSVGRSTLALGLSALIFLPAFINMGVVLGLLPTKGLVLPLISFGGSSMVASLCIVGLIANLATLRK